ncbi:hypothetical protein [Geopseudomonas aromaticivorans]
MVLPLAPILMAGARVLGTEAFKYLAKEAAFKVGEIALTKMLPNLGADPGDASMFSRSSDKLDKTNKPDLFDLSRGKSKAGLVKELAGEAFELFADGKLGKDAGVGRAIQATQTMSMASDLFSTGKNASQFLNIAKGIDMGDLLKLGAAGGAAGIFMEIYKAFQPLIATAHEMMGDLMANMDKNPASLANPASKLAEMTGQQKDAEPQPSTPSFS